MMHLTIDFNTISFFLEVPTYECQTLSSKLNAIHRKIPISRYIPFLFFSDYRY